MIDSPPILKDPLSAFPEEWNAVMDQAPIAYLPFGTVEWHGPHLPLGVDVFKIEALVETAVQRTGGVVFPTVTWNRNTVREVNGEPHEGMEHVCGHLLPGNLHFLTRETFESLVEEMVAACFKRGFKVVCAWSGHHAKALADSIPALQDRLRKRFPERGLVINSDDQAFLSPQEKDALGCAPDHAGKWETSVMLAVRPEGVRLDKLEGRDPAAVGATDNGVMGSTAILGQRGIELCGEAMAGEVMRLLDGVTEDVPVPRPMPEAGL